MTALNPPGLQLFLLGTPHVELAGRSVFVQRRKVLALLAYLAVNRTPQRRDNLAAFFWPESSQSSARTALSRHCSILKQLLGDQWFTLETEEVGVRQSAEIWLDATHFQQTLAQCTNTAADPLALLTNAVALYRADFLSGFTLSDCPDFDDWQAMQTETLRQAMGDALAQLVQIHLNQGSYTAGIAHARRWLSLDPWQELAHQQLMTLHVQQQAPAAAMRHYEQYQQTLADEIGVAPGAELTALCEQIRRGELAGAQMRGQERVVMADLPAFLQELERETVAQPDMPFVAREQELTRLQAALDAAKTGQGQPCFVIGGPGRGKTTLLTEFARRALAADPDLLVISGHANAYTGIGDPYLPWRSALNLLLGDVEAKVTGGLLTLDEARRLWRALPITLPLLADHAPDLVGHFITGQPLLTRAALVADTQSDWLPHLEKAVDATGARLEQSRLFAQFTALLHAIAAQRPLLLILEDLHWADVRGDLQRAEDGSWVAARPIDWAQLPAKIEGVIEQRLAGLAEDLRQALTIASVEGETFTAEVVAQVQGGAARTLVQRLSGEVDRQHHLVSAQALEWVGSQRLARYRFRHHLFQRYLYGFRPVKPSPLQGWDIRGLPAPLRREL